MPSVNPYTSIGLGNGLSSNGPRRSVSPRAEDLASVVKIMMYIFVVVMVVFGFNRLAKRNRELSSLRAELQDLDKRKREQERILVNLKNDLSKMKDGRVITAQARRLGLRPWTPEQVKYRSQLARRESGAVASGGAVASVSPNAFNK